MDGDIIRKGVNKDLGFTAHDREENLRRVAEIGKILINSGTNCIASFIAPYEESREIIKNIIGKENYIEVYLSTSIRVCEERDVKGLYKKARQGIIKSFSGITDPYEVPTNPNITIDTALEDIDTSTKKVLELLI